MHCLFSFPPSANTVPSATTNADANPNGNAAAVPAEIDNTIPNGNAAAVPAETDNAVAPSGESTGSNLLALMAVLTTSQMLPSPRTKTTTMMVISPWPMTTVLALLQLRTRRLNSLPMIGITFPPLI